MHAVILSGGIGSRLWPISRKLHPKPFIKRSDGLSILQHTFLRAADIPQIESIINVTNAEFIFRVKNEYKEIAKSLSFPLQANYILEPFGKNTAAAIALSTLYTAMLYGNDAVLLVLPSDHLISNKKAFNGAVKVAQQLATEGKLVTFGIKPTSPETGFGYIEFDGNDVKRFIEKPSRENAEQYLDSGHFLWNSGMFCFQASTMLQEMSLHCPEIVLAAKECFSISHQLETKNQITLEPDSFDKIPENSIDYAVMEKSAKVAVIQCDIGWNDVGTWSSVSDLSKPDNNGNVIHAEAVIDNVTNCYIESNNRVIGAIGIDSLVIIDTADALLVANKNNSQDVKKLYNQLMQNGHKTHEHHVTVHRPWGTYTILEEGNDFKIKRIEVNPGASLSLQLHNHRSEHGVVISGVANVINDEKEFVLKVSESTYIPAGCKHRLSNPSMEEKLTIIEVQTGNYLGEDDITRFDDIYGRANNE